ncbi:hypothetical protein F5Y03DRAFT_253277 [Xylaria venustula]|nr:hypothetical protein F5Y03DRAFT_253277 [Xylaria venustula]
MSSSQDLLHTKVADLRQLLQNPSNEDKVGPLVTALLAGKVDIHARMLADLAHDLKECRKIIGNPEHRICVTERIDKIEQDMLGLQQFIQSSTEKDIATEADVHELNARLTEASRLNHSKADDHEKCLEIMRARMEGLERTVAEFAEFTRAKENAIASVRHDVYQLRDAVEKVTFDTPMLKPVTECVCRAMKFLDQVSDHAGDVKLSLTTIGNQQEILAGGRLAESEPVTDSRILHNLSSSQGYLKPQNPNPRDRSAVTEFVTTYEDWRSVYKSQKPSSDSGFIENFLKALNLHVSCALQRFFLEKYPRKVAPVAYKSREPPKIFITLTGLRWLDVRRAIHGTDIMFLQSAVDDGLSGLPPLGHTGTDKFTKGMKAKKTIKKR